MDITFIKKPGSASEIAPERLANNSTLTEQQKISEASRQFEAILLRQILASSQKTVISSKLADNSTTAEIYRDMITTQLADSISKSGSFGLAKTFEHQLTRPGQGTPAPTGQTTHDSPNAHPVLHSFDKYDRAAAAGTRLPGAVANQSSTHTHERTVK